LTEVTNNDIILIKGGMNMFLTAIAFLLKIVVWAIAVMIWILVAKFCLDVVWGCIKVSWKSVHKESYHKYSDKPLSIFKKKNKKNKKEVEAE
jgi:hypothetical protein